MSSAGSDFSLGINWPASEARPQIVAFWLSLASESRLGWQVQAEHETT